MVLGKGGVTQLCCQPQQPFDIISVGGGTREVVGVIVVCPTAQHLQGQHPNTVSSMQVVQAVWIDWLTVGLLLWWWKTSAYQRAGLCGQSRQ